MMCHTIGGTGAELGPTLDGWGRGKSAEVIATAIIKPSAEIAHGYEGSELRTKDGLTIQGVLLKEGDPLMMRSMGGVTQIIPADRVAQRRRYPGLADDERGASSGSPRRTSPTWSRSSARRSRWTRSRAVGHDGLGRDAATPSSKVGVPSARTKHESRSSGDEPGLERWQRLQAATPRPTVPGVAHISRHRTVDPHAAGAG